MAEPLEQQLVWDISAALASVGELDSALTAVVSGFEAGLTAAVANLSSVSLDVDTSALTSAVDSALTDISTPIPVEGDTSALDAALADALDAPRDVTIDGDTAPLTDAIDTAVAVSPVIDINGDTAEASAAIDALNTSPVTVDVDADTSEAQDALDALGVSATQAKGSAGGEGLAGLEGAVLGVKAATGAAAGEVGGLTEVVGGLSASTAGAVGAGAAFTAFLGETVHLAADAQAQGARFNDVFGQSAAIVKAIDVGGLSTDLEKLGHDTATTNADLEASATRIGLLGQASGAAQPEVAKTASDLLGLAGALAVANPRLGDTATVADTISRALATGRTRSLIPYGISISQNAILQEALNENLGKTKDTLTGYDKLVAGLTLALDQQGNTLGDKYAAGIQNAQVQLRGLKVDLEETLVAVGGPLLEPVVASLSAIVPVAQEVGVALGEVAQTVLPLIDDLNGPLSALAVVLGDVAVGVSSVDDIVKGVPPDLLLATVGLGALTIAYDTGAISALSFAAAVDFALGPVGLTIAALGALAGLGALRSLSHDSKDAAVDTSELSDAFNTAAGAGAGYVGIIDRIDNALEEFLTKQLDVGKIGDQPIDALNTLGITVDTLRQKISGSQREFDKFDLSLLTKQTDDNYKSFNALLGVVDQARETLEANARATLDTAIQTGVLTRANSGNAHAFDLAKTHVGEEILLLRELAPALAIASKETSDSTFAVFKRSAAEGDLQNAIRAGAITLADAKNVATQYNLTQDQATEIIQNTEAAQDRAAASTLQHTNAYRDLITAIATGSIGEIDAQLQLQAMGFSADGAAAAYKALGSTISAAVQQAVGNLPTTSQAAKQWQEDISSAFKQAAQDAKDHTGNVKDDLAALAADADPAKFAANLIAQAGTVVTFEEHLKTLIAEGLGGLAGFLAQQPFDIAGPLADKLASDESKAKLVAAAVRLSDAVSGPEAQKFFDDHAAALGLAVGTTLANGVVIGAPAVTAAVDQVSADATAHFHPDFTGHVSAEINAAASALTADPRIGQAAGQKGLEALAAYEAQFGPVPLATAVQIALAGATAAINADPTLASATGAKGTEAAGKFKPDISAAAKAQFDAAEPVIRSIGSLTVAAGDVGHSVGVGFDSGVAEGINEPSQVQAIIDASSGIGGVIERAIKARLGIKSPSTVGIGVGEDVIRGVVVGLGDTGIITIAGATIGTAIATAAEASISSVVAGFNDSVTTSNAIATLQALVAKAQNDKATAAATSAASSSFASFVSSVISQFPGVGSAITTFSTNLATATTNQANAFVEYKKAVADYRSDAADVVRLTNTTGIAFGVLSAATQRYNTILAQTPKDASDQQKRALKDARDAMTAARRDFDHDSSQLESAQKKSAASTQKFHQESTQFKDANNLLNAAQNPDRFAQSLNQQTHDEQVFEANLRKLIAFGDTDLAEELAKAGVDAAGKLAAGLASSKAKAGAAEAAVDHATAFTDSYTHFLETQFAPKVQGITSAVTNQAVQTVNGPVAAGTTTIPGTRIVVNAATAAVAPPANSSIELDLTVALPDGTILRAQQPILVTASPTDKTRVKSTVVARVNA